MNIAEITAILPHRYPFLLVDRVIAFTPNERIVAYKNVTANEQFFQGHFPGQPVMPGVLILEALAQAGGILAFRSSGEESHGKLVYLMGIDAARFRRPVIPGDRLTLTVETLRHKSTVWKQRGVATVDGAVAAEAEFLATISKPVEAA